VSPPQSLFSARSPLHFPCNLLLALSVASLAPDAFAQADADDKRIVIPKLEEADLRIDGTLDEAQWAQAMLVEDFHQYEPVEYAEPSLPTKVWVFYTEDALYIGSFFAEPDPSLISANIMRQGQGLVSDDILAVVLDPYLDRRNGYRFEVNSNGVRWEGLFQNITDIQGNWDGIWQAGAKVVEDGWWAEMRIPFQTISFNPDSDSWGINFRRAIRRQSESIAWVSRNRQVNPSVAGTISGLTGMRQGIGLDVVPSFSMREERLYGPASFTDQHYEPSLDVFYKVTPQLNAALTINTDFSATEVDNRQVNLTRFNLFFPERRDFFIREADIFEFGQIGAGDKSPAISDAAVQNGRPFFSRRIGLSARGTPVDINYGGKLSGRVGDWNVGALLINQDEDRASGVESKDIFVGRAALNVLSESQVGMIATSGDPQSNLDNTLVGMDFRYRNSRLPGGRTVQADAFYQQSDTEGLEGDDASWGLGVSYPTSQGWRGSYNYKQVQRNFNPAVGFVNQADLEDHALDFGYRRFLKPGGYLRSIYSGFDGYRAENLRDGTLNNENLGWRINFNNNSGDGLFVRAIRSREVLGADFVINRASNGAWTVRIPQGDYAFTEGVVGVDLADQRLVSGRISMRWGDYFDGNRMQRNVDVNIRPTARYNFGLLYNENEIHLPHGHFTVRLYGLRSQVAFSNTLAWSTLVQYDNVSEGMGINSRLHWIPEAGKQMFLVLNYGLSDADKDNSFHSVSADLSLKLSYTLRF